MTRRTSPAPSSTYRLQFSAGHHFADAVGCCPTSTRSGVGRAVRLAAAGGGRRLQPRLRRRRPDPGLGRAGRRAGPPGAGRGRARARAAVRAGHRAQPRRGRPSRGPTRGGGTCCGTGRASALRRLLRHRLGRRPDCLLPVLDADEEKALSELGAVRGPDRAALLRARLPGGPRHRRDGHRAGGARAPALPAGVLAARRGRADLPAVLRRLHAGRGAGRDPGGVRGHPPRGAALGAPRARSTGCASTTRTGCPIPAATCGGCARRSGRTAGWWWRRSSASARSCRRPGRSTAPRATRRCARSRACSSTRTAPGLLTQLAAEHTGRKESLHAAEHAARREVADTILAAEVAPDRP